MFKLAEEWLTVLPWLKKAPTVSITYPIRHQTISYATKPILVNANANDPDGIVLQVEFFANGKKIGQDTDPDDGWSILWFPIRTGHYMLTALATDDDGMSSISDIIELHISSSFGGGD